MGLEENRGKCPIENWEAKSEEVWGVDTKTVKLWQKL